jgi:hypothetical protein
MTRTKKLSLWITLVLWGYVVYLLTAHWSPVMQRSMREAALLIGLLIARKLLASDVAASPSHDSSIHQ